MSQTAGENVSYMRRGAKRKGRNDTIDQIAMVGKRRSTPLIKQGLILETSKRNGQGQQQQEEQREAGKELELVGRVAHVDCGTRHIECRRALQSPAHA